MIALNSANLANAIRRAKSYRPRVRFIGFRTYQVESRTHSGVAYVVRFGVNGNGSKQAHCECPAGQQAMACYHVAAAVALHIAIQSVRVYARESRDYLPINPS